MRPDTLLESQSAVARERHARITDPQECYAHGRKVGRVLELTLAGMEHEFGSPDADEVLLIAEGIREALWDRLDVTDTDYAECERGMCSASGRYDVAQRRAVA